MGVLSNAHLLSLYFLTKTAELQHTHVLVSYHNEPDDRRSNIVLFLHLANNVEQ